MGQAQWQIRLEQWIGSDRGARKRIAAEAGIGQSYLTRLLKQEDANPGIQTLDRLARATGEGRDIAALFRDEPHAVATVPAGATAETLGEAVPYASSVEAARLAVRETFHDILVALTDALGDPGGTTPHTGRQTPTSRHGSPHRHPGRRNVS
jgi:transcriptional regulator with XRE-family HTH domain